MTKLKIPFSVRRKSTVHSNSKEKTKYWRIRKWIETCLQESTHSFETPFQEKIAKFLRATSRICFGIILFRAFAKKKINFFPNSQVNWLLFKVVLSGKSSAQSIASNLHYQSYVAFVVIASNMDFHYKAS